MNNLRENDLVKINKKSYSKYGVIMKEYTLGVVADKDFDSGKALVSYIEEPTAGNFTIKSVWVELENIELIHRGLV